MKNFTASYQDDIEYKKGFCNLTKSIHHKNHVNVDDVEKAFKYISDNTFFNNGAILNNNIYEFRSIVLKRDTKNFYNAHLPMNHTIQAVNEVISPFFADAVKTTMSFLFSGKENKILTIKKYYQDDIDTSSQEFYDHISTLLSGELLTNHTNFYTALSQVIESYYMYGLGVMFLTDYEDKETFFCSSLDIVSINFIKDNKNNLIGITCINDNMKYVYIRQLKYDKKYNDIIYPEIETYGDEWLEIVCENKYINSFEILNHRIIPYQPIHILMSRPVSGDTFKEGVGLSLLTEIKNYNNIYNAYIDSISATTKSILIQNSGIQYGDKEGSISFSSTEDNVGITRMVVTGAPTGISLDQLIKQIPIQHKHEPLERLLQSLITRMREQFPFITRFLNLIGDTKLTATEATIRNNADLGKLRDDTEYFYRTLLENLNLSQLTILDKFNRFKSKQFKTPKNYKNNIVFSYDSLYKRQEEAYNQQQVVQLTSTVSNILDLKAKDMQLNQGNTSLNYDVLIRQIANIAGQDDIIQSNQPLKQLSDIFNNPEIAQQESDNLQNEINNY